MVFVGNLVDVGTRLASMVSFIQEQKLRTSST